MADSIIDGNLSWDGGMDASRFPSFVAQNQYFRGCNVQLPSNGGGVSVRDGIHHCDLDFQADAFVEDIYKTGHIQAEGWFNDGVHDYLVVAVNGYVLLFEEIVDCYYKVTAVNRGAQRNPDLTHTWFTRVPGGVIYQDGIDAALFITSTECRLLDGDDDINPGKMGVYVQNRYFYVTPDCKSIEFSDFGAPTQRTEAINANVLAFPVPEDFDEITAIAKQKVMWKDTEGGKLIFGTLDNVYSVDVRGDIQNWGFNGIGEVQESIPGLGPASPYSFEPSNTNIYFRSREYGVCDLRRSQFQFARTDDLNSQSIEVDYWLSNDTEWMLDQCYTRGYNHRLYTTVGPEFREDGYVFWNGLISYNPDPEYSNQQQGPRRFESLITGVRPWCLTGVKSANRRHLLFIHSYDKDGVNRLYRFADSDHDINHHGCRIEIEGWIETRGYNFDQQFRPKVSSERFYKLRKLKRSVLINGFTKTESAGEWKKFYSGEHKVGNLQIGFKGSIIPEPIKPQNRNRVPLPQEPETTGSVFGNLSGREFFSRQYRFEFKGHFILDSLVIAATVQSPDVAIEEEVGVFQDKYNYRPDYSYYISNANKISFKTANQLVDSSYPVWSRGEIDNSEPGEAPPIGQKIYVRPDGMAAFIRPDGETAFSPHNTP